MLQPNDILRHFAEIIEKETGIVYAEHNYFQLESRLETICKFLSVATLEALYLTSLQGVTGNFRELLLDLATNNETSFFRDMKIFKSIETLILPTASAIDRVSPELRIWSAASSSGQEALSVAMLIKEYNSRENRNIEFSITATDISKRVIKKAQAAKYTQLEVQRGLPMPYLVKYFTKDEENCWTAKEELTKNIQFKFFNLKEPFSTSEKFSLILCRNMLIYQSVDSKIEILKRLTDSLCTGGYLIMGTGESLIGLSTDFEQVLTADAVFYRKRMSVKKVA